MRNLFALIGLLVVGVGGAGWYLGWYKVNFTKNTDGNLQIQTNVDTKKVSGDSAEFFQKVTQMVNDKVQQANQTGTAPAATPANTPGTTSNGNIPQLGNLLNNPANSTPSAPPPPPPGPME